MDYYAGIDVSLEQRSLRIVDTGATRPSHHRAFMGQALRDYNEAAKWFKKAADQGDAEGQVSLAGLYQMGQGVPKDRGEALRLYNLAASQHNINGLFNLGNMYNCCGRRATGARMETVTRLPIGQLCCLTDFVRFQIVRRIRQSWLHAPATKFYKKQN
jgi:hypothetical protein